MCIHVDDLYNCNIATLEQDSSLYPTVPTVPNPSHRSETPRLPQSNSFKTSHKSKRSNRTIVYCPPQVVACHLNNPSPPPSQSTPAYRSTTMLIAATKISAAIRTMTIHSRYSPRKLLVRIRAKFYPRSYSPCECVNWSFKTANRSAITSRRSVNSETR